jgi:hypothetical protein
MIHVLAAVLELGIEAQFSLARASTPAGISLAECSSPGPTMVWMAMGG